MKTSETEVCVIGSGAGAGPVIHTLALAGCQVTVLEKGPWFREEDFYKDDLACCRRSVYTPDLRDEYHVVEQPDGQGGWTADTTYALGWDWWNGNCVGGASNFMSGFFHRLKPVDFRLRSTFGPIAGANVVDWPIGYEDLEPWYTYCESVIGISGRVVDHPYLEPRSTPDYPFPPTREHPVAALIDRACERLGYRVFPLARAILPHPHAGRGGCSYSGFCGSYGCATGAKGSARAALIGAAVATGRCEVRPHAHVFRLVSDRAGRVVEARYFDARGEVHGVRAELFVVACQAVETVRLLLLSPGPRHPRGLGNNHGQLGRNLIFSAGGAGGGDLHYADFDDETAQALRTRGPFVNRALQDWYEIRDPDLGHVKGGTVEFLFSHPSAIGRAIRAKWDEDGRLLWGEALKRRLYRYFTAARHLRFEVFCDWLPTDDCFVTLDPGHRDKWGLPVARIRTGYHPHDLRIGRY
ncbi:MAG: GMC family oxidoreductase, partial [Gammaproteobacteria bacterium]